jgi:arylsulfatase A-like enzyme
MAEKSSEIPHVVEEIRARVKFRPATAIRVALLKESAEFPFLAGWALARLLAWALFDQHESHRIPEDERENRTAYRPFRPRYAYKAGQLYLWYHLEYFYQNNEASPHFRRMTVDEAAAALALYFETAHVKKRSATAAKRSPHFITTKAGAAICCSSIM